MSQGMKSKIWILLGIFLATGLAVLGCFRIYYRMTDDFRVANITYEQPNNPQWDIPPLTTAEQAHLDQILSQKYYYIGKGAQSYAFSSADEKYVLKFFKYKHLKPSFMSEWLPPVYPFNVYKDKQASHKLYKLNGVFTGYRLAYETHKEDSGLVFIHLNTTDNLHEKVTVVDKLGFERTIDLDPIVFIVQEKAKTTRSVITGLLDKGDIVGAKSHFGNIIDLYMSEYKKGIYDRDHGVMHNTGFVGDRPIHLDVGKLTRDESMKRPEVYQKDMARIREKFQAYLEDYFPNYYTEIIKDIDNKIKEAYDKASSTGS